MICVSMMLALFLAWPLVFGGPRSNSVVPDAERAVMTSVGGTARAATVSAPVRPAVVTRAVAGACLARFHQEEARCMGSEAAQCRALAYDDWNRCEMRGVWPD